MTHRIVYSTDAGRRCPGCGWPADDCRCSGQRAAGREALPSVVTVKLHLEKRASGKSVTVIDGLPDNEELLARLSKEWKKACGTGGSAGRGAIELQGDQRERLRDRLAKKGWKVKG